MNGAVDPQLWAKGHFRRLDARRTLKVEMVIVKLRTGAKGEER